MASADLTSARSLADRAQEQFDALKAKADAFLQEHPWGTEVVRDDGGWALVVKIPKQPPEDWWMDLGEMADNARAALNHLAFQLVIANGQDPDESRVQFPIFEVKEHYFGNRGMKSNREKMLAGIGSGDRKVIDKMQPYNLGAEATDHPLSVLRSLTDRHKHRERHVGAMAVEQYTAMMHTGPNPLGIEAIGMTIGNVQSPDPLVDGHVLHRVQSTGQPDREIDTPADFVEKGGPPRMILSEPTGISPDSDAQLTVAFFGDRPFKINDIGRVPPYVRVLIERFERRIAAKRPGSGASR